MTPVTLVTRDATLDDLSLQDYADMVAELRQAMSFDKMIAALGSVYSKALWAKVADGATPNREQRNELRRYFGKPALPPTVAECTSQASPDAAVWTVGEGVPDTVVMVALSEPVTLRVNGTVTVCDSLPVLPSRNAVAPRKAYWRTCMSIEQKQRTEALNRDLPVEQRRTPQEIYDIGLKACEVIA